MNLPTPRLDDRTFQQLVDEAKRQIQHRCPTWSDHNVSDPGVTLIETFAWMTDMLLYRLNRVPDQLHVRFLELMGVRLFPPQPARTQVSFRLSAHQPMTVRIPAGTGVSTRRSVEREAICFTTGRDLYIPPATSSVVARRPLDGQWTDLTPQLGMGRIHEVFSEPPRVGDAIYIGLDEPTPQAILLVQVVCAVGGHGILSSAPPLRWEAATARGWLPCEVRRDDTHGFNVSGSIELHVPADHVMTDQADVHAAWLRCVVTEATPAYRSSPRVSSLTAATIGGDIEAVHAEPVHDELLGVSDGTTGQTFVVNRPPVLPDLGDPITVAVGSPASPGSDESADEQPVPPSGPGFEPTLDAELHWETWRAVDDFAASGPDARHVTIDRTTGEIRFGPVVRLEDGSLRRYGAIPPRGAVVRIGRYWTGGGAAGNVAPETISVLRSSIPYVAGVYNRMAATGGVDGETVDEARLRGPLELRRTGRAVTAEDFATITRQAAPELVRVHCVPMTEGDDAGVLQVLVVPQVVVRDGRFALRELIPPEPALARVVGALDRSRVIGTRILVRPPTYVRIRIDARVRAREGRDRREVEQRAVAALFGYFNPLTGGPDGRGWPFGRPIQVGEAYSVLSQVDGVDYVEQITLAQYPKDQRERAVRMDRIDLSATSLVFSEDHAVAVESAG